MASEMISESSLNQVKFGSGYPVAEQRKETELFAGMLMLPGGTEKAGGSTKLCKKHQNLKCACYDTEITLDSKLNL